MTSSRPLPFPSVDVGAGTRAGYAASSSVAMPMGATSRPSFPAPDPAACVRGRGAVEVLEQVWTALETRLQGGVPAPIDLGALSGDDLQLVDQLLGEGEVAAQVTGDTGLQAQESVFAGVWRVLDRQGAAVLRDTIEVGAVPQGLLDAARSDAQTLPAAPAVPATVRPADTMNAPSVLEELRDKARVWRPGDTPHVVNLTLLPLSPGDLGLLDAELGRGRVVVLSRGCGNCRIVNTRLPRTWRVTYFNAFDRVILDTLEVATMPEVACAAVQDLEDSAERLGEMLDRMRGS